MRRSITEPASGRPLVGRKRATSQLIGSQRHSRPSGPVASESQEQRALIAWWETYARSKGIDPRLLIAIPNGGHLAGGPRQRAIQMRRLKLEGLRVGCPDLFLAVPRAPSSKLGTMGGLWIELKTERGKASEAQYDMLNLLGADYCARLAFGWDDARRLIEAYLR